MNQLEVNIFTPQELNHSSYVQTGLFELEHAGFLKTKVILSVAKKLGTIKIIENEIIESREPHPKTSFYQLVDKLSGKKINFAIDLYDAAYSFSNYALENCDFVFKRNFETKYIEFLPENYQKKLRTFGLTFTVKSKYRKKPGKFLIGALLAGLRLSVKFDRRIIWRLFSSIKEQLEHRKLIISTRSLDSFEKMSQNASQHILFQTRCFPYENQKDAFEIHQQRYRIIKLLREKYKEEFTGGFIPSELANEKYSDALTNLPSEPNAYLEIVRNAKIVVYTRGLANSPAWKMAEYLSQGKVIVAEPLTTELPLPLEQGNQLLFFNNNEELIQLIETVQKDETLASNLSKNARSYFDEMVHPAKNLQRILELMLV